jgi:hypothetical protein
MPDLELANLCPSSVRCFQQIGRRKACRTDQTLKGPGTPKDLAQGARQEQPEKDDTQESTPSCGKKWQLHN